MQSGVHAAYTQLSAFVAYTTGWACVGSFDTGMWPMCVCVCVNVARGRAGKYLTFTLLPNTADVRAFDYSCLYSSKMMEHQQKNEGKWVKKS